MIFEQFSLIGTDIASRFAAPMAGALAKLDYRWFFGYLVLAAAIGFLILWRRNHDPNESIGANVKRSWTKLFARDVLLHESARLDYRYAIINHMLTSAVLIYLIIAINVSSTFFHNLIEAMSLFEQINVEVGIVGAVMIIALYAFAYDTANFFQHILQHKIPVLWEFHKVHHSAEVLTPVTAVRLHPVAQIVSASVGAVVYGLLNGLAFNVFAGQAAEYSLIGANMFGLLFYTVGLYHLKHSHIWFTYPRYIKGIFASPSLHLIHHSNKPKHYDKNFGFVFTFWDRIFGSYYDPADDEQHDLVLGISASEGRDEYRTVRQLYLTPFKRAWQLHVKPIIRQPIWPKLLR